MGRKWLSGRRRQTVNLLVYTLVGSNPTFLKIYKNQKFSIYNNKYHIYNRYNSNKIDSYRNNLKNYSNSMYNLYKYNCKNINRVINHKLIISKLLNTIIYLNRIQLESNKNVVPTVYQLNFNYKRNRFFPSVCYNKISILNSSLGIISKYFDTKKSFLKSKSSYILSILYIKRLLLSIPIYKLNLNVVRIPIYLKDMVNRLLSKDKVYLENPFIKNQYVTYNKSLQISFI